MTEQMLMKDGLNQLAIERISSSLSTVVKSFNQEAFSAEALDGIAALELKERVVHLIAVLHRYLPTPFKQTVKCLRSIPPVWDYGDENDPLRGFAAWPLIDYIGEHGLDEPELALEALADLTELFSAEFAIRYFILRHQNLTLQYLSKWVNHKDEHVRRLVSEGSRPRLPWGKRLQPFCEDPTPILPLLEKLKHDPSLYVRRSVANNLNDIAKDHPETVLRLCRQWQAEAESLNGKHKEHLRWIIRHATRTLVKQGHPESFAILGYTHKPSVVIESLNITHKQVKIGDSLEFNINWLDTVKKPAIKQTYVMDYAIHFVKANGSTSPKVFKLKNCESCKGESQTLTKRHNLKRISTRKYYPGEHFLAIHINGVEQRRASFLLV